MSVQFGRLSFEGHLPAPEYIEKVSATLAPYGPDSNESYSKGGVKILYRALYTTKESRREMHPHISSSGAVITWDGRLDNRAQLVGELRDSLIATSTDVEIVAAAYDEWGAGCLGKLIGDWALSIWNSRERSLILAKDFVGTHHLYYSINKDLVTWCTILDPLVLFAGKTFSICEEYIAGWFAHFPAAHLTPYVGIHAVPPSSFVLLRAVKAGVKHTISKYWDFDPGKRIRYRTDAEYEEHFRSVLVTAVQRRLRSDRPILAELSGGMDSSSMVCIADTLIARGAAETPRLDTISWYDDLNPCLDERPYFTKVEEKRRHTGYYIDLGSLTNTGSRRPFEFEIDNDRFCALPNASGGLGEFFNLYATHTRSQGHRVTLSGIGGDEATGGGVPTPIPELQNLLARVRLLALKRQLNAWAVKMRRSRFPLFWEAARGFVPLALSGGAKDLRPAAWFHPDFVRRNHAALSRYPSRVKLFGPLPSFQDNMDKLDGNRRFLAFSGLRPGLLPEKRFPYFDRDMLEFAYAIPRGQIVGVGRRRYLMKRALTGIVPDLILERRQRATSQEQPKKIPPDWVGWSQGAQHMVSGSMGIIDPNRFLEVLEKGQCDDEVSVHILSRTLTLESWLHHLASHGVLTNSLSTKKQYSTSLEAKEIQAPGSVQKFS